MKLQPIVILGLVVGGIYLLTRRAEAVPPEEEIEAELKIEIGSMNVFATEVGKSNSFTLYELTFSAPITNVGDAPAQLQLVWGTKNYFSTEWEEEVSRTITIQPGQTYVWTWTFEEAVEDYYKGYFTCILYIDETGQSATGIWA